MMNTAGRLLPARFPNHLLRSLSSCRKVLPPELSTNTLRLTCDSTAKGGVCDVLVVGIRHDTQKSCQQVRDVLNYLKPEVVFLELCKYRAIILEPDGNSKANLTRLDRCRALYAKVTNQKFESEFGVANEEAQKYGAKVILGDRAVYITDERFRRKLLERPLWHIMKFLTFAFQLPFFLCNKRVWQTIKNKENKNIILGHELIRLGIPALVETIVDERDQYMSAGLLQVAREHNSVVAVVGKGHLPGIQKYWKQPIQDYNTWVAYFNKISSRKIVPPELFRDTLSLTSKSSAKGGVCDVLVIGTRHNTQKSREQVRDVLNFLKPEAVFLGLCEDGYCIVKTPPDLYYELIPDLDRCSHLRAQLANKPSESEFRVAYEEAQKNGAKVILGDLDHRITTDRFEELLERPLWRLMKLLTTPFQFPFLLCNKRVWQAIKNKEYISIILKHEFLRLAAPALVETMVDERAQIMSAQLEMLARKHNTVVAVVGKGHLPGIKEYWKQGNDS